jgi:hypothetical protein
MELENLYTYAFNQYYATHPHLHGFYDANGCELDIGTCHNIPQDLCAQCNRTHLGKYGLENTVFRDYLELTEYDPRYDIVPYMPSLDKYGVPVLDYPSRPMFPRFYMHHTPMHHTSKKVASNGTMRKGIDFVLFM